MTGDHNNFGPRIGFAYRPEFPQRCSNPRRLRHLLHATDFKCDLRDGGRRPGHCRRKRHREHHRRSQSVLQQRIHQRRFAPASTTSPSATIQKCATPMCSNGTSTFRRNCPGNIVTRHRLCRVERNRLVVTFSDINRPIDVVNPTHARSRSIERPATESVVAADGPG